MINRVIVPVFTPVTAPATGLDLRAAERRRWGGAGAGVVLIHAAALGAVLALTRPFTPPEEEPVVLVELPPPGLGPQLPVYTPAQAQPLPNPFQPAAPLPFDVPPAPVPPDSAFPPPSPAGPVPPAAQPAQPNQQQPAQPEQRPSQQPAQGGGSPDSVGSDPAAARAEADYKSLVGSYIRRNRFSPPQSRKAGISGDVRVRFVVNRSGAISNVSVAGSSGHALLDGEAVAFIQRLTPVPAFPRDLRKAEIPLTITLKFDLERR